MDELDLSFRDTSNWEVTSATCAYAQCLSLKRINFGNIDTSNWPMNATNAIGSSMFYLCLSLKELDFSKFDTRNWQISCAIDQMFTMCYNLERVVFGPNVDTSGWDITSTYGMCSYCRSLKEINISSFLKRIKLSI